MSRKDYQLIADAIRSTVSNEWCDAEPETRKRIVREVAVSVARALARDNYRFNHHTFMDACGVE